MVCFLGRRKEHPALSDWHPILSAVESPVGVWVMVDPDGHVYGRVEIRRTREGVRYRCEHAGREAWADTLKEGCMLVHRAFLRGHGPQGGPIASWGER